MEEILETYNHVRDLNQNMLHDYYGHAKELYSLAKLLEDEYCKTEFSCTYDVTKLTIDIFHLAYRIEVYPTGDTKLYFFCNGIWEDYITPEEEPDIKTFLKEIHNLQMRVEFEKSGGFKFE